MMISSISWVPKGASNPTPIVAERPSKEEIEEMMQTIVLERSGDVDGDDDEAEEEDEGMDVDTAKEAADELSHALAAAEALSKTKGKERFSNVPDIADGLRELDMDHYDDDDAASSDAPVIFRTSDVYYPSNDMDPYLKNKDDDDTDDDEEVDDRIIKPTDLVIVCAKAEEVSELEVWVVEELEEGEPHMYVHHAIMLPAFPLCTAWLDCNLKSGDKGNFIAVGSMETAIEIWDLDLEEELQPFLVLGGISKKKRKGKKTSVKYKKGSHRDSVLGLAWNKEFRNVLASASADNSVKVWDMVTEKCSVTADHHTDKVQAVAWSPQSPEVLLSGSFDHSLLMTDMRSTQPSNRWSVVSDVESLAWDPHNEHSFVVSLENGTVQGFDTRVVATDSSSGPKPSFTIHAHDKAVSSISYNPSARNLLATGSTDKMVKLWDLSNNQPSCVASRKPDDVGAVFSISFAEDSPFLLAIGGSNGKLDVWHTLPDLRKLEKFSNLRTDPKPSA